MCRRSVLLVNVFSLGARFLIAQASPEAVATESFGPGEQALYIGAAAFQPVTNTAAYYYGPEGYLYRNGSLVGNWVAPITLPAGAEVYRTCLYAYDNDPDWSVSIRLEAVKLAPAGQPTGLVPIPGSYAATTDYLGYQVSCNDVYSYIYRDTGDVDGDGTAEHLAHRLQIQLVTNETMAFGGVRLFWHRQLSPPPPVATFDDVPTLHPFFRHIEALFDSGITAGCGPGVYCPDRAITRGEMAVFLAKALGLHRPY